MRLVILGPPGAGKGTQAKRIAAKFDIPAISTGDIFRANVQNRTELGVLVEEIMSSGKYVPDEVTNDLVRNRLLEADCAGGFLLDGYPRTSAQVDELDAMLAADGHHALDAVLELTVDVERWSAGCSTAAPPRAGRTTPKTSSVTGRTSTTSRPRHWCTFTRIVICW